MPIRRFDHRARFRAAYLNNTIDQLDAMNKTWFHFSGQQGGNVKVAGTANYSLVHEIGDHNFYCPPIPPRHHTEVHQHIWLKREAIPTWGHTGHDTRWAMEYAATVSANAASYLDDFEANGWGGYDVSGVTAGTYGAPYDPPETEMRHCLDHYPNTSVFWTGGHDDYPNGINWRSKAGDSPVIRVYPDDPNFHIDANVLSVTPSSASLGVSPQAVGFMYLLQNLPPGSVILDARIPVRVSNFSKRTQVTTYSNPHFVEPYIEGGFWVGGMAIDTNYTDTTETSGSVSFTMMGRRKTGTYTNIENRVRRSTSWDVLSGDIASEISTDAWSIIDLTATCNAFLSNYKYGEYFGFVLFPSAEGTPLTGGTSLGGYLASLPQRPVYQITENPSWDFGAGEPTAKNHGYNWNDLNDSSRGERTRQDIMWTPEERSWDMWWGGLMFGEGIIEFKYPDLRGKYITAKTIVRGDSPILV